MLGTGRVFVVTEAGFELMFLLSAWIVGMRYHTGPPDKLEDHLTL